MSEGVGPCGGAAGAAGADGVGPGGGAAGAASAEGLRLGVAVPDQAHPWPFAPVLVNVLFLKLNFLLKKCLLLLFFNLYPRLCFH